MFFSELVVFKVLILVLKAHLGLALKYLCDLLLRPNSRSLGFVLFDPLIGWTHGVGPLWLNRDPFASIGPSLWTLFGL